MKQVVRALCALRDSGELTDVTIKCAGHRFRVHSAVIGARSTYFLRVCMGQKKESNKEICIQDHDARVVAALLQYLYEDDYTLEELREGGPMDLGQRSFLLVELWHLKMRQCAAPFLFPFNQATCDCFEIPNLGLPFYRTVIEQPMDLGTLETQLNAGKYLSLLEFQENFNLLAENSDKYNGPDHPVTKLASLLRGYLDDRMGSYPATSLTHDHIRADDPLLQVSVWRAAATFEIPGLADLAYDRAKHAIAQHDHSNTFHKLVEAVYQTPEDPFRATVLEIVRAHQSQLLREGKPLRKLLRSIPGFAADILESEVDGRWDLPSNVSSRAQGRERSRSPRRPPKPEMDPQATLSEALTRGHSSVDSKEVPLACEAGK